MIPALLSVVLWPAVAALAAFLTQRYFHARLAASQVGSEHQAALGHLQDALDDERGRGSVALAGLASRIDALEKVNFELNRQANIQKMFPGKKA